MKSTIAIITAAGSSHRFNNSTPKQFTKICNKTIIDHSIEAFAHCTKINEIIVVINKDNENIRDELIKKHNKISNIVIGGNTRQASVYKALSTINSTRCSQILIHDAARPFVKQKLILRVLSALLSAKAVIPVIPIVDAVKKINNNEKSIVSIDRKDMFLAQTPQGFDFSTIYNAHKAAKADNMIGVDDAEIISKYGIDCTSVRGDLLNYKITFNSDINILNEEEQWFIKSKQD